MTTSGSVKRPFICCTRLQARWYDMSISCAATRMEPVAAM
jgi:hypothetical protein